MFTPENTVIGFIGIGVMGKSMASHLLSAGFPMIVYNRSKEKAEELVQNGAIWVSTPKEVAEKANVIFTIVGYPKDVEEVYLGEQGIVTNGKPNTYVIDMTTSTPTLAVKIYEEAKKKGNTCRRCTRFRWRYRSKRSKTFDHGWWRKRSISRIRAIIQYSGHKCCVSRKSRCWTTYKNV